MTRPIRSLSTTLERLGRRRVSRLGLSVSLLSLAVPSAFVACGSSSDSDGATSPASAPLTPNGLELEHEYGVQPGWVRAVFLNGAVDAGSADPSASFVCDQGDPASVTAQVSPMTWNRFAVDVKANLPWLSAHGLPRPCHVASVTLTFSEHGTAVVSSTAPYAFQMDLPLAYLTPQQLSGPVTGASVSLAPSTRRHVAYPPRIVAIRSADGRTAFAEVEELADRGTVGLRGMSAFYGGSLERELGGGAEIYPGWGLDVDRLGVTKVTSGVEESHPGFDEFTYSGTAVPALLSMDKSALVFPAPPLFSEATYLANVLDNHGVARCTSPNGCLDVVYDAADHALDAVNGAAVQALDTGLIPSSTLEITTTIAPPAFAPPPGTAKAAPVAGSAVSFARSSGFTTTLTASIPRAASTPIVSGMSCALDGTTKTATVALTRCGGNSAAIPCPTAADPMHPDDLPTRGTGAQLSLSRYVPYYAGRTNVYGDCASHAAAQYTEYLYNRLAADALPREALVVDGDPLVAVPTPPIAFSPSAGNALWWSEDGLATGDPGTPWPATSGGNHPLHVPEAYWPAREGDWSSWVNASNAPALVTCRTHGWSWSSFCIGQGSPTPGTYWSHDQQVATFGENPVARGVWGLADSYLDVPITPISEPPTVAYKSVIRALQAGLPVLMSFAVDHPSITDATGRAWNILGDTSWYLPPELAGCTHEQLDQAFAPRGAHAVNIVGYSLRNLPDGTPDPIASYFILSNNWGKGAGNGGFYAMSFAAFAYTVTGLDTRQLNCDFDSPACTRPSTGFAFQKVPNVYAIDVGASGFDVNVLGAQDASGSLVRDQPELTWSHEAPLSTYHAVPGQYGVVVDVGAYGPWVLNAAHEIYGSVHGPSGVTYGRIGGEATDVGVSGDGNTVYVVGVPGASDGKGGHAIYRWRGPSGGANPWVQMTGQYGVRVDAANDGSAWITTDTGAVWHVWGDPAAPSSVSVGAPGTVATDVTVGYEGDVFVVGGPAPGQPLVRADYPIYSYDPDADVFRAIAGAMGTRLSAGLSSTALTVVNASGAVWTTERVYLH